MIDGILRGADVSGTSSIIKVFYTELLAGLMREMTDLQGLAGQVDAGVLACAGWETGFWMNDYLHSFGWIIGGGTNEIQRNVIGERMLGLPREATMTLTDDERDELRSTACRLLDERSSSEQVRAAIAGDLGFDRISGTRWSSWVGPRIHVDETPRWRRLRLRRPRRRPPRAGPRPHRHRPSWPVRCWPTGALTLADDDGVASTALAA